MKKELFNDALNYIDNDLVEEYVKEKEALQAKKRKKKITRNIISLAACFVICFLSISVIVATSNDKKVAAELNSSNDDDYIRKMNEIISKLESGLISVEHAIKELEHWGVDVQKWEAASGSVGIKLQALLEVYDEYREQITDENDLLTAKELYEQAQIDIIKATTIAEMDSIIDKFEQDLALLIAK